MTAMALDMRMNMASGTKQFPPTKRRWWISNCCFASRDQVLLRSPALSLRNVHDLAFCLGSYRDGAVNGYSRPVRVVVWDGGGSDGTNAEVVSLLRQCALARKPAPSAPSLICAPSSHSRGAEAWPARPGSAILVSSIGLDLAIGWCSVCGTAPHARCFHHPKPRSWARRCRGRWPYAFSATNDVSMNVSR